MSRRDWFENRAESTLRIDTIELEVIDPYILGNEFCDLEIGKVQAALNAAEAMMPDIHFWGANWHEDEEVARAEWSNPTIEIVTAPLSTTQLPVLLEPCELTDIRSAATSIGTTMARSEAIFGWKISGELVPWTFICGDTNGDELVDLADFSILKENFGQPGSRADGDLNGTGSIKLADFTILKDHFSVEATPVPEPHGIPLYLIGTGLLAIGSCRRRRAFVN